MTGRPRSPLCQYLYVPLALCSGHAAADGIAVTGLYHPYVEPGEQEIEYQGLVAGHDDDHTYHHAIALESAIGQRWQVELKLLASDLPSGSGDPEAIELGVLRQLTEQGEYWADVAIGFEFEREFDEDIQEAGLNLIVEKEIGRWSHTANLLLGGEWGRDVDEEAETALRWQSRLRWQPTLEPALEFFAGEDTRVAGPALRGQWRLSAGQRLKWEAGWYIGFSQRSPDRVMRFQLEYEF